MPLGTATVTPQADVAAAPPADVAPAKKRAGKRSAGESARPAASEPGETAATAAAASAAAGPSFQISVVLAVDPRLLPATLITVLPQDPMVLFQRRVEAARPSYDRSKDVLIGAAEAQFIQQGASPGEAHATAARMIEQQFMTAMWDAIFQLVRGDQIAIVYSIGLGSSGTIPGTLVSADFDTPAVWITTRAISLGERFGAWAVPVPRDRQMPVGVPLDVEHFSPLRISFARVKV